MHGGKISGSPADIFVVSHVRFSMSDKVHAVLPVQRFMPAECPSRSVFFPGKHRNIDLLLFTNAVGHGLFFFRFDTCQLKQFSTRRSDGVRPVVRAFGLSYTTGNLVKNVGRGYGAMEGG